MRSNELPSRGKRTQRKATKSVPIPAYRKAIVTFIDILGFREMVRGQSATQLLKTVKLLQSFAASGDSKIVENFTTEGINWTRSFAFSDTIVRVRPYDADYSEGSLYHELISLVHAQAELARLGVLIRGGVTAGDIYFEEDALFGPALVAAYDLESAHAIYPRIVLDPEALKTFFTEPKLRAEHHDIDDEVHYVRPLLERGDDGLWFVNYLGAIFTELDNPEDYKVFLEEHRKNILKALAAAASSARILHKYLWLARYHNRTCDCMFRPDVAVRLKIQTSDFDWLEDLPDHSGLPD